MTEKSHSGEMEKYLTKQLVTVESYNALFSLLLVINVFIVTLVAWLLYD